MDITRQQYQDEVKQFWSKKCERLEAEINRLKEELSHYHPIARDLVGGCVFNDRIIAENKRLKEALEKHGTSIRCPAVACQHNSLAGIPTADYGDCKCKSICTSGFGVGGNSIFACSAFKKQALEG